MKVLLIGKNGMLGKYLFKMLAGLPQVVCFSATRNEMDITHKDGVYSYIESISPDFVINAAAYTNVDGAEMDSETAFNTNALACDYISNACKKCNAVFLHISTDYVFGGNLERKTPYTESSVPSPINEYGRSKLAGENFIKHNISNYFILRTASLFGDGGRNFVDKIIKLANNGSNLKVVDDQVSSPTYVLDLAAVVVNVFLKPFLDFDTDNHKLYLLTPGDINDKSKVGDKKLNFGTYHIANSDSCSWYEFAKFILSYMGNKTYIERVVGNYFNLAADRPNYSVIKSEKLNFKLRPWKAAVAAYLDVKYKK